MQLKMTTTPYGGFGDCYHLIADRIPAQVRDSTLTVVAGGVVYRIGGVAYRTSVSSSWPSKSWWTTVTHTSRGGEVRGEEKGGGVGEETLHYLLVLKASSRLVRGNLSHLRRLNSPPEIGHPSKLTQCYKAQQFHYISIHTDIHNAVRFGSEEAEVLTLFKAHLHHAWYSLHA